MGRIAAPRSPTGATIRNGKGQGGVPGRRDRPILLSCMALHRPTGDVDPPPAPSRSHFLPGTCCSPYKGDRCPGSLSGGGGSPAAGDPVDHQLHQPGGVAECRLIHQSLQDGHHTLLLPLGPGIPAVAPHQETRRTWGPAAGGGIRPGMGGGGIGDRCNSASTAGRVRHQPGVGCSGGRMGRPGEERGPGGHNRPGKGSLCTQAEPERTAPNRRQVRRRRPPFQGGWGELHGAPGRPGVGVAGVRDRLEPPREAATVRGARVRAASPGIPPGSTPLPGAGVPGGGWETRHRTGATKPEIPVGSTSPV